MKTQIKIPVRFKGTNDQLAETLGGLGKFTVRVHAWMRQLIRQNGWDGATATVENGFVVVSRIS